MADARTVTLGKYRALRRASTANAAFTIVALDHQDVLRRALRPDDPLRVTDEDLTAFKLDVLDALQGAFSGALLDPVWGAPQAVAADLVGGLLVELEKADYSMNALPLNVEIRPAWNVAKIKRMGADGAKLFFYYHPDEAAHAAVQERLIRSLVVECSRHDIPLYAEPIRYPRAGEDPHSPDYAADATRIVVESARRIAALGVDVLKLEFPLDVRRQPDAGAWVEACARVTEAIDVPWALLSAGVDFETFARQVEAACKGGASGFIAGRALWGEACAIAGRDERRLWLEMVCRERMARLAEIADRHAAAWTRRIRPEPTGTQWFSTYGQDAMT